MVVTVETDIGITGIGEGGTKDTLEQCAGTLIGQNPFQTEALWQEAYIAWFYPPGPREGARARRPRPRAVGHQGQGARPPGSRAARRHGARLLRVLRHRRRHAAGTPGRRAPEPEGSRARDDGGRIPRVPDGPGRRARSAACTTRARSSGRSRRTAGTCAKRSGPDGNWCIDFHQRFDLNDALRVCKAIEEYEPFFVEDPVRDENALQDIPKLRQMTTVPLTHGEEWGLKWDFNRLVENHDVDFIRSTLPNVGGITEMMKVGGNLRDARRRHHPALHRTDRHRRARELPLDVLGAGADGIQLRRPADRLPARVPRLQERQGLHEPAARPRRDAPT